ncbi:MAG: HIRAN domain-containing protein [Candidatus Ornithomonoglobus sp.]
MPPGRCNGTACKRYRDLYDNNAVRVDISVKGSEAYNLGYIPRNLAYVVSAILDKGIKLTAAFKEVRRDRQRQKARSGS